MTLTVIPVPAHGAEDVAVALDGTAYTGTADGTIWRIRDGVVEKYAETGGRPLGIEVAPDGRLLVCDATLGLFWVGTGGTVSPIPSVPMVFCNNAAIASDGTVWFSDSSRHYSIGQWKHDLIEDTRSGRLLRLLPDGTTEVMIDGLAFANGVALAEDESFVAVAETAARTVVRLWLTGPRAGTRDLLCADLPGYPDNIARGSDGLIWVTIASPTDRVLGLLHRAPLWVRRLVARVPEALLPKPKQTARVQAYDQDGTLVHDLDLPATGYHMVTGVREHDGRVWLGSLDEPAVAVWDLR